jgi:hypothetical protein
VGNKTETKTLLLILRRLKRIDQGYNTMLSLFIDDATKIETHYFVKSTLVGQFFLVLAAGIISGITMS